METIELQLWEPELVTDQRQCMDKLSDDLAPLIFKRIVRKDPVEFTMDSQMFRVIRELDGAKTFAAIAQSINMDIETLTKIVQKLVEIGIIGPANDMGPKD